MAQLDANGSPVDVAGLVLRARGFSGRVERAEDIAAQRERGGDRDVRVSLSDRLLEGFAGAPEGAFDIGSAASVEIESVETTATEPTRGEPVTPLLEAEVETPSGRLPILLAEDEDGFLSWELPENHDELVEAGDASTRDGTPELRVRGSRSRSKSLVRPTGDAAASVGTSRRRCSVLFRPCCSIGCWRKAASGSRSGWSAIVSTSCERSGRTTIGRSPCGSSTIATWRRSREAAPRSCSSRHEQPEPRSVPRAAGVLYCKNFGTGIRAVSLRSTTPRSPSIRSKTQPGSPNCFLPGWGSR